MKIALDGDREGRPRPRRRPAGRARLSAPQRRRQIIERASVLFAERGFTGVTVKDLAGACRVNQAILYRHFRSKRELHRAVVEEKIAKLDVSKFLENLDREQPLGALLEAVALQILAIGALDPDINRLLFLGALQKSDATRSLFRAWRQPFVDLLQGELVRRIERGEVREVNPHITARSFVGMVMDCSMSCFLWPEFGYEGFDAETTVANNAAILLKGLSSDGPPVPVLDAPKGGKAP